MLSRLGALRLVLQNATLRALAREQGPCANFMGFRPWIREQCRVSCSFMLSLRGEVEVCGVPHRCCVPLQPRVTSPSRAVGQACSWPSASPCRRSRPASHSDERSWSCFVSTTKHIQHPSMQQHADFLTCLILLSPPPA